MKLAGADPIGFTDAVYAHAAADGTLFIAHDDGTISRFNDRAQLKSAWLNLGKRVSCLSVIGNELFIAFEDKTVSIISLETGLLTKKLQLPKTLTDIAVFEHIIVGWSQYGTEIYLLHRVNYETFQTLEADSFVVKVFAVSGSLSIVCSKDIYLLQTTNSHNWELVPILSELEHSAIDACAFQKRWFVLTPESWKTMSMENKVLKEELAVNAPIGTVFKSLSKESNTIIIQCTNNKYVIVRDNNIQVLDSPGSEDASYLIVQGSSTLISTSTLTLYSLSTIHNGELQWHQTKLNAHFVHEKYLPNEQDPQITATFDDGKVKYVGTQDGKVNGIQLFPSAVLSVDAQRACSANYQITLPPGMINIVSRISGAGRQLDRRVTSKLGKLQWGQSKWIAVYNGDLYSLYKINYDAATPAYLALPLATNGIVPLETAFNLCDKSPSGVSCLEDMVVTACDRNDDKLLSTACGFLKRLWTSERVEQLINARGPRSLKVLAAASTHLDIDEKTLAPIIHELSHRQDAPSCDGVLWVYEHNYKGVSNLSLPFASLRAAPESRVSSFASKILTYPNGVRRLLESVNTVLTESKSCHNDIPHIELEASAISLLLAGLELPGDQAIPHTDDELLTIVKMTIPAVHSRVPGAKSVFLNLLSTHHVQFFQARQKLLVPTINSTNHVAVVFDMDRGANGASTALERPSNAPKTLRHGPALGFSGDGKTVNGVFGKHKYAWHLSRGIQSFFVSSHDPITPVEI